MHEGRIENLCATLIDTLWLFEKVQRKFHPIMMRKHGEILARKAKELEKAADGFLSGAPDLEDGPAGSYLLKASALVNEAAKRFNENCELGGGVLHAMQAGRKICQACEILFGLRYDLERVDDFFREDTAGSISRRGDGQIPADERDRIVHMGTAEDIYARGNASLFVPESSGSSQPLPLVIALHGGFGHGRDFIWSWVREARSRRFFLLAPTSMGRTWSITDPEADLSNLCDLIEKIGQDYPVDRRKILLTGLSDGATFSLVCAMRTPSPFSAFNPVCGILPPGDLFRARGKRILWIHGAYDWMFPAAFAGQGYAVLLQAGANVTLKIIPDLAHAYPREENARTLSWFDPGSAL